MIAYRQPIVPHDKGRDVLATKRALRRMGYTVTLNQSASSAWEHAIRVIQHKHGLHADGIYGEKTHAIVAPHWYKPTEDKFAIWLYEHAKIRHRNPYVNPFSTAYVQVGRVDAGCDYHGRGPIRAIGDGVVYGVGSGSWTGWPGGEYLYYRLTSGPLAGRFIYIAEGISPVVRARQKVKAGQILCNFRWDSAPGMYPGIEFGWASPVQNVTYADATGESGGPARSNTEAGRAFARFLKSVHAPAPDTGAGPLFP